MTKVFVAYQFQDECGKYYDSDRQIVDAVKQLVRDHHFEVVTGESGGGGELRDVIREFVRDSDGLVAVMTRRDHLERDAWTVSDWVKTELQWARDDDTHAIALVESGAAFGGPYAEGYEEVPFERSEWQSALLKLSGKIARWREPLGAHPMANHGQIGSSHAAVRIARDMPTAIRHAFEAGVERLDVFGYVGKLTKDALRDVEKPLLDNVRIRLLVRDPDADWAYPSGGRADRRKRQILDVAEELASHDRWEGMAHRRALSARDAYMRYWQGSPTVRAALAEMKSGASRLCLGFYPLRPRVDLTSGQRVRDFSGTDRPVLVTEDGELVDDFRSWFEFMWEQAGARIA